MDPVSIAASAVAFAQALGVVGSSIRALRSLGQAPAEFADLLRDLVQLQGQLELSERHLRDLQRTTTTEPYEQADVLKTTDTDLSDDSEKHTLSDSQTRPLRRANTNVPSEHLLPIKALQGRLNQLVAELNEFSERYIRHSKGRTKDGLHQISKVKWLREKAAINTIREHAKQAMAQLGTSYGHLISLQV
jgi:hypothetical protein